MRCETHGVTILITEDDDGHAELIIDHLRESGIDNRIVRFRDGQEALDFFFLPASCGVSPREPGNSYVMLLDIRMPKVDGIEVLRQVKQDSILKSMPVIMLTTTEDPLEVETCYALGCSCYVTKPVDYEKFSQMLTRLGLFLLVVQVPVLAEERSFPVGS